MKKRRYKADRALWIIIIVLALLSFYKFEPVIIFTDAVQTAAQEIIGREKAGGEITKKIALTFDDGPHPIYTP